MELGPYTLQVFTSLVVILGAACVALICDFLKGNNEQLRELTIELKVRREEEHKRIELMLPHLFATPQGRVLERAERAIEEPAVASASGEAVARRAAPKERKRAASAEAMSVMERGARAAASVEAPAAKPAEAPLVAQAPASVPHKPQLVETPSKTEIEPQRIPEQVLVAAMAASAGSRPAGSPIVIQQMTFKQEAPKKDWNSLLAARRKAAPASAATQSPLLTAVMEATTTDLAKIGPPALPAGFQNGFVVSELIATKQPVNGLVMSIGVSASQLSAGSLPERVHHLIRSLLGPNDFATQSTQDEFLLIFPNERGAAAQRRLSQVAQQLWDFQLQSLEAHPLMFSWGGLEVRNEPINEAIASANERMQESRRGRRNQMPAAPAAIPAEIQEQLRHAV